MDRARAVSTSIWSIGSAVDLVGAVATVFGAPPPAPVSSSTEPHVWHSPQRPTHLVADQPHSEHLNAGRGEEGRFTLVEVTSRTLDAGSDTDVEGTRTFP